MYPFRSQNVVNLYTSRNVKKTRTFVNSDPVSGRHGIIKTTHASSEVVGRRLDVAVGVRTGMAYQC